MAFFDRMTNESFRRSESGEVAYFPPLMRGPSRLVPTARDEAVMRRAVRNTLRYVVLFVCPITVLAQIYPHMDGPVGWRDVGVRALLIVALFLPVEIWLRLLSKRFAPIDVQIAGKWMADAGDGPTLGAAIVLSGFTAWIGFLGLVGVYGLAANYFHF